MTPKSASLPRILKQGQIPTRAAELPTAAPTACAAPAVRLVRVGDAVKSIRVDCLCGRSLEIECLFDDGSVKLEAPQR